MSLSFISETAPSVSWKLFYSDKIVQIPASFHFNFQRIIFQLKWALLKPIHGFLCWSLVHYMSLYIVSTAAMIGAAVMASVTTITTAGATMASVDQTAQIVPAPKVRHGQISPLALTLHTH